MSAFRGLVLLVLVPVLASGPAAAGVPGPERAACFPGTVCPDRSGFVVSGMGAPCHFRFLADGSRDQLVLTVTVRDLFDTPIAACSLATTLRATPLTGALCLCEPARLTATSDANGVAQLVYSRIGGRGELALELTAYCGKGIVGFPSELVPFTSPDLDGSCDPGASTDVFDLGIWAMGLPPGYAAESDFNCDGVVNVFDLGDWAGGLGKGCGP